jgi:hypothetical protein
MEFKVAHLWCIAHQENHVSGANILTANLQVGGQRFYQLSQLSRWFG